MKNYDMLKLENQVCFPLYAASKEVIKKYKKHLDPLNLTYTQYIAMMVIWESPCITSKELGCKILLDSGTFTPVLKKLEAKGYIERRRHEDDERNLAVTLTKEGSELKDMAISIPQKIASEFNLTSDEFQQLHYILNKMLKPN